MDPLDEPSPRRSHHDSDADATSPASSSNYSSCDGSEFDRYCSANSALGSASLCSSVGNYSELLVSSKSSSRWNGFDGLSDGGGVESPRENGQDAILMDGATPSSRVRAGSRLVRSLAENSSIFKGSSADDRPVEELEGDDSRLADRMSSLAKIRTGYKLFLKSAECSSSVKGKSVDNVIDSAIGSGSNEEEIDYSENLSWEHSEDEDSSIGYDSGDESRIQFVKRNSLQVSKETENESGNPLVMNSLVAFGANDWDEFEQERGEDGLRSLSLYEDRLVQHWPSVDHVDDPSVVEKESDVEARSRDYEVSSLQKSFSEETSKKVCMKFDTGIRRKVPFVDSVEVPHSDAGESSTKQIGDEEEELTVTPSRNSIFEQSYNALNRAFEGKDTGSEEVDGISLLPPLVRIDSGLALDTIVAKDSNSIDVAGEDLSSYEAKKPDTIDSYDDMVLEMEEILLDSKNSHGARSTPVNGGYAIRHSHNFRDGSSTASTSGTDDVHLVPQYPSIIDRIEVVGAKQKKGDVSFGERLVGVKEYTIYKLQVWSGKDQWEVERRYRDFFALYRQFCTLFTDYGLSLPSPWSRVEQESRKIFGNASPDVISERSILIQDCLQSILNSKYPFGTPSLFICFLSPGQAIPNSSLLKSLVPKSFHKLGKDQKSNSFCLSSSKDISVLGKTISLVVEIKPRKSLRQLLEAQHYACAGCHSHLDAGNTLLREIVQTFGWNKPRFCEYTSQLFCASCHTNDTVVLPAKVLHHWDFSLYPVSQLAKSYLESIYDQPMLCVSAVNPFLFSKVPALLHVMGIRKKIGTMIPYVRCPFRMSVQRSLGIRRYLLEGNDFLALRDLVDLSKGAFAALPAMIETVLNKFLEHITEQCLVCYDSGIPCAARQDCEDPASVIFPFQEAEAEKCNSCGSLLHRPCFVKLMGCCACGKLKGGGRKAITSRTDFDGVPDLSIQPSSSSSSSGFLSEILSRARPDKMWRPKNSNPVILLMGSLPSTSL